MSSSPVIRRYARALIELAQEKGTLEEVRRDMALVHQTIKHERELQLLLKSPLVKPDRKARILDKVFASSITEITGRFIAIMVRKGREVLLPQVAENFLAQYQVIKNIHPFSVTSAVKLSDAARTEVLAIAATLSPGKLIELSETVDPSIIGGIVLRLGDEQYDASVSRRLHDQRKRFSENPYVPQL